MINHSNDSVVSNDMPRNIHSFSIGRNHAYRVVNQDDDHVDRHINRRELQWPFIRIGLLIIISPFIMAFVASLYQGGSMFNEGTGTGVLLWFLFLTIPIGLLIIISTIVIRIFRYCWRVDHL
jgi:hypothetical protein